MKFILIAVFILSMTETKMLKAFCAKVTSVFHQRCLNLTNEAEKFKFELDAIVCGHSIQASSHSFEIKKLGVIHIFVVSGAHFITLQFFLTGIFSQVIRRSSQNSKRLRLILEHIFLGSFLLITGFCAPALRSMIQISWRSRTPSLSSKWLILGSGLLCALLIPSSQYFSLQLSWLCALILSIPGAKGIPGLFLKSVAVFLGCAFLLSPLSSSSLMCILANLFLAPLIAFGLFPLGILAKLIPQTSLLFDSLLQFFYFIGELIGPDFYLQSWGRSPSIQVGWILIGCLHLSLHLYSVQQRRKGVIFA